jgi:hypothetical protein
MYAINKYEDGRTALKSGGSNDLILDNGFLWPQRIWTGLFIVVCAPTTANTNILEPAVPAIICKRSQQDRAQHLKIILVTEHKGNGRENKLGLSFVRHLLERSEGNKRYDSRRREINRNAQRYCAYASPCVTINNTSSHDYQGQHAELQNNKRKFYRFSKDKRIHDS